jgi:2-dehydro-3-deoxyphosphooctonate aldolase (KDO 8-P synthase)
LREVEKLKTLTDVHDVWQVGRISTVVDVMQIPAFLCRQTDLIEEAARFSKILNVKKGQFLAPWDVANIVDKVKSVNPDCEVWITERGTSGMQYILDQDICTLVFDATHSAQQPGGEGTKSGGNREYAKSLAYAAAGMGVQNFFMEVHPDPDNAPSDGPNMIRLEDFEEVISKISKLIRS